MPSLALSLSSFVLDSAPSHPWTHSPGTVSFQVTLWSCPLLIHIEKKEMYVQVCAKLAFQEIPSNCSWNLPRYVDFIYKWFTNLLYILHIYSLSRFDILGTMKRKLRTDIHYPLTNLDLTPYICPVFRKHPKYNLCAVVVSKILFKTA